MFSGCYVELLADPALLQSFPQDEWTSIHELSYLDTLHFQVVSEGLFSWLISLHLWGQAKVDFITNSGRKAMGDEVIPMTVLVTDGVDEGSLGMATIFSQSDQAKVEPSAVLLILLQWESSELGIVLMKIFTNSPYFQQGSFGLPFLDIAILPKVLHPSDLHFPSYVCATYSSTPPPKSFCPKSKSETGLESSPSPKKHCGRTLLVTTVCPPRCYS